MTPAPEENIRVARRLHGQTTPTYLMGQRNGKIRKYQGVQDLLQRNVDKNGLDDIHLHDFRADAITGTKMQGLDPRAPADDVTEAEERASLWPEVLNNNTNILDNKKLNSLNGKD